MNNHYYYLWLLFPWGKVIPGPKCQHIYSEFYVAFNPLSLTSLRNFCISSSSFNVSSLAFPAMSTMFLLRLVLNFHSQFNNRVCLIKDQILNVFNDTRSTKYYILMFSFTRSSLRYIRLFFRKQPPRWYCQYFCFMFSQIRTVQ